jgi:hypothetical protein
MSGNGHVATVYIGSSPDHQTNEKRLLYIHTGIGITGEELLNLVDNNIAEIREYINRVPALSFKDALKLNSNMDIDKNYLDKETEFYLSPERGCENMEYGSSKITICTARQKFDAGYVVLVDDVPKHIITIYEPHGAAFIADIGAVVTYGHEEIIILSINSGNFTRILTR